ncbi:MAG: TPM domain-containing protein, partial [Clostridia bacterium]|nr:TPM domain-containing protein [Clostridia bacterium]
VAVIPESRLYGDTAAVFAKGLFESSEFGYGPTKDGFMFIYLEDRNTLTVLPMGGAIGLFSDAYISFLEERIPSLREKHGVSGVVSGCIDVLRGGFEALEEKNTTGADETTSAVPSDGTTAEALPGTGEPVAPPSVPGTGDFERCGKGSGKPEWFPKNLDEAYVYFDADAPRILDYAGIIADSVAEKLKTRISQISDELGKDIVIVTDVSDYGLGNDIYAADCFDYNGYGIGENHEGILLFINMNPSGRGGWTCETGPDTRGTITREVAERLDDFLYETLGAGEYDRAFTEWVEDVYSIFTRGIARPPFWYFTDGKVPENYYNPSAPVVVDELGLLNSEQTGVLTEKSAFLREKYGLNVYFHSTGDFLNLSSKQYNELFMRSMGYEKNAILISIESVLADFMESSEVYFFGSAAEKIPSRFQNRINSRTATGDDAFERMLIGQDTINYYMEHGRVPRSVFYWILIALLALVTAFIAAGLPTRVAESSMYTVNRRREAHTYLDRAHSSVRKIAEVFLYNKTERIYIGSSDSGSGSSGTRGGSGYKSNYSGHSGVSHSGHGRSF